MCREYTAHIFYDIILVCRIINFLSMFLQNVKVQSNLPIEATEGKQKEWPSSTQCL